MTFAAYYGAADTTSCVATFRERPSGTTGVHGQATAAALRGESRHHADRTTRVGITGHVQSRRDLSAARCISCTARCRGRRIGDRLRIIAGRRGRERAAERSIYTPCMDFEQKKIPGGKGCEDPRVTKIGDRIYMCYTAYDGKDPPRVAFTSIAVSDFLAHQWKWVKPILISPPNMDDKDAALFFSEIDGQYVFLHRLVTRRSGWMCGRPGVKDGKFLKGEVLVVRATPWDSKRIASLAADRDTNSARLLALSWRL